MEISFKNAFRLIWVNKLRASRELYCYMAKKYTRVFSKAMRCYRFAYVWRGVADLLPENGAAERGTFRNDKKKEEKIINLLLFFIPRLPYSRRPC